MSEVILGKLIEGTALRDAIHVAVVPLIAGEAQKRYSLVMFVLERIFNHG